MLRNAKFDDVVFILSGPDVRLGLVKSCSDKYVICRVEDGEESVFTRDGSSLALIPGTAKAVPYTAPEGVQYQGIREKRMKCIQHLLLVFRNVHQLQRLDTEKLEQLVNVLETK